MSNLVQYINPSQLPPAKGLRQAVKASGGSLVFFGQVALNQQGELVGEGDLRKQSEQVFENIRRALEEAARRARCASSSWSTTS